MIAVILMLYNQSVCSPVYLPSPAGFRYTSSVGGEANETSTDLVPHQADGVEL